MKEQQHELISPDEKSWRKIDGWFSDGDAETYRKIAAGIPRNGAIAEIGCWMGRSLAAFVYFCGLLNKTPRIHAIDTFQGTPGEPIHSAFVGAHGGSIRRVFEANMKKPCLDAQVMFPVIHELDSVEAAKAFGPGELDAVFIDANHSEKAFGADLAAWLPKVRPGGYIAGHDFDRAEIRRVVFKTFKPEQIETIGGCWLVHL